MSREEKLARSLLLVLAITMLVAGIMLIVGCGPIEVTANAAPPPVDTSMVVSVMGRFVGGCHVCPTGASEALTAAHCIDVAPFDPEVDYYPLRGESPSGWSGLLVPAGAKRVSDLAIMQPEPGFEAWYSRGARPQRGDTVTLVGFDRGRKDPLGRKVVKGEVTSVVAGHFSTNAFAGPGSSGGCVLDVHSRVVGIVSSGLRMDEEGKFQTVAVGVWEGAE